MSAVMVWMAFMIRRARFKRDGTRAETKFGLTAKRTSPFKLAGGGSVHSTSGSRSVRISGSKGSNAGCIMFWGRVQDYWLPTPLACFPFTSPTVRHRVPSGFNWALPFVPRYLREEEEHKPLDPSVQILTAIASVLCMTSCQNPDNRFA